MVNGASGQLGQAGRIFDCLAGRDVVDSVQISSGCPDSGRRRSLRGRRLWIWTGGDRMRILDRGSRDFFGIGSMLGLTGTARESDRVIDRRTAGPQDRRTAGPQDRRTAGPQDRRTAGPQDRRTAGPQDRRIAGSQDRRTAGPQDRRTAGPQDRRTAGPQGSCARVGHERVFMAAPPLAPDLPA